MTKMPPPSEIAYNLVVWHPKVTKLKKNLPIDANKGCEFR